MFIIIYSTFCIDNALCQVDNNEIIPPSPTAASLGQFGGIPIGYYTGTPNISIPLYEIKSGNLTLPITMSYQSTGLRVAQDASWVGLGWSLSAGGLISRVVRGGDDFSGSGYYNYNKLPPYGSGDNNSVSSGNTITNHEYYEGVQIGAIDAEPDIFSYNFGNYSGTFVIDKYANGGGKFCAKSNNLKIEIISNGPNASFKIITPDGVVYVFGTKEIVNNKYTKNITGDDFSNIVGLNSFPSGNLSPVTSWYLDSITAPNGDYIDFTYVTGESLSLISQSKRTYTLDHNTAYRAPNGPGAPNAESSYSDNLVSRQYVHDVLLSEIEFKNGRIDFITSDRDDIEASTNSGAPNPQKLSNIKIKDTLGNLLKNIVLSHSYFNSQKTGYYEKRLKLEAIRLDNNPDNQYSFEYESPNNLPSKYSTQYDELGFYTYPFPTPAPDERSDTNGAYVKRGMLKTMTYPTKGRTEFEYEVNSFNSANLDYTTITPLAWLDYKDSDPEHHVIIPVDTFSLNTTTLVNFVAYTTFSDPNYTVIARLKNSSGVLLHSFTPTDLNYSANLASGTYTIEVTAFPSGYENGNEAYLQASYKVIAGYHDKGKGLRIKNITNYDNDNNVIGLKHFIYTMDGTENGSYSGTLLTSPITHYQKDINYIINQTEYNAYGQPIYTIYEVGGVYDVKTLHSTIAPGFYSTANTVAYSMVTVQDGLNADSGSTSYEYHNEIFDAYEYGIILDQEFPEMPNMFHPRNGQLLSITEKNSQGITVKSTVNNYLRKDVSSIQGVKFYNVPFSNKAWGFDLEEGFRYYDNISEWWVTSSVIETLYDKNGNNPITTTTYYDYENPDHKNLTKTTTTNSKGETIMATNKYPQDLPSGIDQTTSSIISGMVTDHIIAPVLKSETTVNGNLVQGTINNYKTQNGLYLPLNIKKLKRGSTIDYDKDIEFVSYDNNGHIQEIKKPDGTPVSYVWGYNKEFPIAKIENATYSQVLSQVANLQDLSNLDDDHCLDTETCDEKNLRTALTALRTSLSGAMVSTYTYDPLIGVTSMTDPKGYTVYYEYDVYNRLEYVKDASGKILSRNEYRYKTQP